MEQITVGGPHCMGIQFPYESVDTIMLRKREREWGKNVGSHFTIYVPPKSLYLYEGDFEMLSVFEEYAMLYGRMVIRTKDLTTSDNFPWVSLYVSSFEERRMELPELRLRKLKLLTE